MSHASPHQHPHAARRLQSSWTAAELSALEAGMVSTLSVPAESVTATASGDLATVTVSLAEPAVMARSAALIAQVNAPTFVTTVVAAAPALASLSLTVAQAAVVTMVLFAPSSPPPMPPPPPPSPPSPPPPWSPGALNCYAIGTGDNQTYVLGTMDASGTLICPPSPPSETGATWQTAVFIGVGVLGGLIVVCGLMTVVLMMMRNRQRARALKNLQAAASSESPVDSRPDDPKKKRGKPRNYIGTRKKNTVAPISGEEGGVLLGGAQSRMPHPEDGQPVGERAPAGANVLEPGQGYAANYPMPTQPGMALAPRRPAFAINRGVQCAVGAFKAARAADGARCRAAAAYAIVGQNPICAPPGMAAAQLSAAAQQPGAQYPPQQPGALPPPSTRMPPPPPPGAGGLQPMPQRGPPGLQPIGGVPARGGPPGLPPRGGGGPPGLGGGLAPLQPLQRPR